MIAVFILLGVVAILTIVAWFAVMSYMEQIEHKLRAIDQKVTLVRTAQLESEQFGTALPATPVIPRHRLQVRIDNKQLVDITTEQPAQAVNGAVSRTQQRERDPFSW